MVGGVLVFSDLDKDGQKQGLGSGLLVGDEKINCVQLLRKLQNLR